MRLPLLSFLLFLLLLPSLPLRAQTDSLRTFATGEALSLSLASRVREGKGEPGKAFSQNGSLLVYCGEGALEITLLQTDKGKRMDGKSYLLGHPLGEGSRFGVDGNV